jgi:GxxExxY protein
VTELLFKQEVFAIVGAAMAVYNELKFGFLEAVYQEALEIEFADRSIAALPQEQIRINYKGRELKKKYVADFLCFGEILVEIKATEELTDIDRAQLRNYLRATGKRVGVLIAFRNRKELKWERYVV